jgi:DeoR/GlpR family transcriptional regulator of sugar metabolism
MVAILDERKLNIIKLLAENGSMQVKELALTLKVTEATIRTDLNTLADKGKVARVHGSARLIENRVLQEYTYQARKNLNAEHKTLIGDAAAQMVNDFDSILLDASTTSLAMANSLKKREELNEVTAIPLGIWTAIELMGYKSFNILLPGGYLRHTSASIAGIPTQNFFDNLIIKKAFLGAWGLSVEQGLTDSHLLEVELKKVIVHKAQEVIILADGSKFFQTGLASYAKIEQVSTIITDHHADDQEVEKIRKLGIEVIIA